MNIEFRENRCTETEPGAGDLDLWQATNTHKPRSTQQVFLIATTGGRIWTLPPAKMAAATAAKRSKARIRSPKACFHWNRNREWGKVR